MRDDDPWLAEAAMHRILRRTLPAQRHEVLGALSALKLQLAVARRRATLSPGGTDNADTPPSPLAQLEAMAEQQLAAQTALIGLRLWDGLSVQRQPLADVLGQSVAWVRQAAAMLGHRLDDAVVQPLQPGSATPVVQVPAAHHLVLGLLYQSLDRLQTPQRLVPRLQQDGAAWRLWLAATDRDDGPVPGLLAPAGAAHPPDTPDTPAGHAPPRISLAMLDALARHMAAPEGAWQRVPGPGAANGESSALRYEPRST